METTQKALEKKSGCKVHRTAAVWFTGCPRSPGSAQGCALEAYVSCSAQAR